MRAETDFCSHRQPAKSGSVGKGLATTPTGLPKIITNRKGEVKPVHLCRGLFE